MSSRQHAYFRRHIENYEAPSEHPSTEEIIKRAFKPVALIHHKLAPPLPPEEWYGPWWGNGRDPCRPFDCFDVLCPPEQWVKLCERVTDREKQPNSAGSSCEADTSNSASMNRKRGKQLQPAQSPIGRTGIPWALATGTVNPCDVEG